MDRTRIWVPLGAAALAAAAWLLLAEEAPSQGEPEWNVSRTDDPTTSEPDRSLPMLAGASPVTADATSWEVIGFVVDPEARPVLGAEVAVEMDDSARVRPVRTDVEGAFRVRISSAASPTVRRGRLTAVAGAFAAARALSLVDGEAIESNEARVFDVGTLRLVDAREVAVVVTHCGGGPAAATVFAILLDRTGSGPSWVEETDRAGRAAFVLLPAGVWRFVATADGCARTSAVLTLPLEDRAPIRFTLGPERTLTVSVVTVVQVDGKPETVPVPEASVVIEEPSLLGGQAPPGPAVGFRHSGTTDVKGETVVRGLGRDDVVFVRAAAPGFRVDRMDAKEAIVLPPTRRVTRRLTRSEAEPRTLRWPIDPAGPSPRQGAFVSLRPVGDFPTLARVDRGALEVLGVPMPAGRASAVAEDGSIAVLTVTKPAPEQAPIRFYPPRRLEVRLRAVDGSALAGWTVEVQSTFGRPLPSFAQTDVVGTASFRGLYGGPKSTAAVFVREPVVSAGAVESRMNVGSAALEEGDAVLSIRIPRRQQVLARVFTEGRAVLPPRAQPLSFRVGSVARAPHRRVEEDATLLASWRPPSVNVDRLEVELEAEGYTPATDTLRFAAGHIPNPLTFRLDLQRPAEVEVSVTLSADRLHAVSLEWMHEKGWRPCTSADLCGEPAVARQVDLGRVRFRRVRPGTYRAVDSVSGIVSESFPARAGQSTSALLDLSHSGWVSGRVLVPSRESVEGTRVFVRETAKDSRKPTAVVPVDEDGTYRIRVAGDRELALTASHPRLGQSRPEVVRDRAENVDLRLDQR